MLSSLIALLRSEYKPGASEFSAIDARWLAEKLDLKALGAEGGKANQPGPAVQQLDAVEQGIVNDIRIYAGDAYTRTNNHIRNFARRLQAADVAEATVEVKTTARAAVSDFDAEILAARSELERAHEAVKIRADTLRRFREANHLERAADPAHSHFKDLSLLFVLFVVEAAPNALILGEAETFGIVGGILQAIIYSGVNLATGFLAGRFAWTAALHRNPLRKLSGIAVGFVALVIIAGLNLALAHYRVAALQMPSIEAFPQAWQMFLAAPFAISDLKSAGMVGMGVLFAFAATYKGYTWQDPYPGYAKVAGFHKDAQDELQAVIQEKIRELKELQESSIKRMRVARARLRDRRNQIPEILGERKRLAESFRSHIAHLQDVGRFLLAAYRDANRAARESEPPAHFGERWILEGFEGFDFDDSSWLPAEAEYRECDAELVASVEQLQASFDAALRWIRDLRDDGVASLVAPAGSAAGSPAGEIADALVG
ncbi:MAG: hypothetical protein ACR65Z_16250 [Methylocystis sp.]